MMKNTLLVCALALSALSFPSFAQEGKEVEWYNVTALNFVATGGKDQSHALQQYLLFDRKVQYENQDLFARYQTFAEEYMQQASAGSSSVVDETIAEFRKILKERPEMAEQLNESIKELEASKSQMESNGSTSYSYDPAVLLKQLTSIAINRKVYTGYKDIGGGLFAVKTGACYGPLDPNAFSPVQTDAQNEYTWGAIDYSGNTVLGFKYKDIDKYCEEYDIIFLQGKEKDGTVRAGARGYDGRVRISFKYDFRADLGLTDHFCIMSRDKKYGFVDYDGKEIQPIVFGKPELFDYGWSVSKDGKNYGIIDWNTGNLVIPLQYKAFWDCAGGVIKMLRFDGKLDVFDKSFNLVRTENRD